MSRVKTLSDIPLDDQLKIHEALSECMLQIIDQVSPDNERAEIGLSFLVLGIFAGNLVCLLNDQDGINVTAEQIKRCGNNLIDGFMMTAALNLKKPASSGGVAHKPIPDKGSDTLQ
jgi:hypothetical protein